MPRSAELRRRHVIGAIGAVRERGHMAARQKLRGVAAKVSVNRLGPDWDRQAPCRVGRTLDPIRQAKPIEARRQKPSPTGRLMFEDAHSHQIDVLLRQCRSLVRGIFRRAEAALRP